MVMGSCRGVVVSRWATLAHSRPRYQPITHCLPPTTHKRCRGDFGHTTSLSAFTSADPSTSSCHAWDGLGARLSATTAVKHAHLLTGGTRWYLRHGDKLHHRQRLSLSGLMLCCLSVQWNPCFVLVSDFDRSTLAKIDFRGPGFCRESLVDVSVFSRSTEASTTPNFGVPPHFERHDS